MYGIDGPRRRPTRAAIDEETTPAVPAAIADEAEPSPADDEAIIAVPDATPAEAVREDTDTLPEHPSVPELWRGESEERARVQGSAKGPAGLEERFDTLRIELEAALDRRIRVAVDQMQTTFDREIESLRTLNREEAKRIRGANDEAFVRVRVSNTAELERIRAAIDEGVARLCSVLEGQLDRVWAANDVELERIRSAGADRLAEVHDLLNHKLDTLRERQATITPAEAHDLIWNADPAAMPAPMIEDDQAPAQTRRWLRRRGVPAPH